MSDFNDIKKHLSTSTTMPEGTVDTSATPWMMGTVQQQHHIDDDDECDEDHTNPSGGCGCC